MKRLLVITLLSVSSAWAQHRPLHPVPLVPPGTSSALVPVTVPIATEDSLRLMNALLQQRLLQSSICASVGLRQDCALNFDQGTAQGIPAPQPKK